MLIKVYSTKKYMILYYEVLLQRLSRPRWIQVTYSRIHRYQPVSLLLNLQVVLHIHIFLHTNGQFNLQLKFILLQSVQVP